MIFNVAWQNVLTTVVVSREAPADLDRMTGVIADDMLLQALQRHEARILKAVERVIPEMSRRDELHRLYLRSEDFFGEPDFRLENVKPLALAKLEPKPERFWDRQRQEPQDDFWRVDAVEPEKGCMRISNMRTDHFLVLYTAHLRGYRVLDSQHGVLELSVRVVFENGHARLERLTFDATPAERTGYAKP